MNTPIDKLAITTQRLLLEHHHIVATTIEDVKNVINEPETIEIAGKRIFAMPLETMAFTPEQQKKFEEAGGLINPTAERSKYRDKMMYWIESFEMLRANIDGIVYTGFDLFKMIYRGFPNISTMTQEEAIAAGLYPNIYYRNFSASKWTAKMHGGHIATLDENFNGELRDIYDATLGNDTVRKLSQIGLPLFGIRSHNGYVVELGNWTGLGSDSFSYIDRLGGNRVRTLIADHKKNSLRDRWGEYNDALSCVIVLDK